jgi:hypothetical protein
VCRSIQFNIKIFIYVFCRIDNVGILKLRNADVENRVGIQKAKKKSTFLVWYRMLNKLSTVENGCVLPFFNWH